MFTTREQVLDFLGECVTSRKMSSYERKKWATAFPDDRIFMGEPVLVRLQMDELVDLIRWIKEADGE